jgi:hypothetical protein
VLSLFLLFLLDRLFAGAFVFFAAAFLTMPRPAMFFSIVSMPVFPLFTLLTS